MAIQKEFILRYHSKGHIRFQLPARACGGEAGQLLCAQLLSIRGVSRVDLFKTQKKLSIRFHEPSCSFHELSRQLFQLLADLEQQGYFVEKSLLAVGKTGLLKRLKNNRVNRWFHEKYQAAKETAQAAKVIGKISTQGPKALFNDPEKAIIDFLNDILALYLIRLHWTRITQEWLLKPFKHRYEWMAVFYLFYLLVRARRKK
jgi:hypothetical protein